MPLDVTLRPPIQSYPSYDRDQLVNRLAEVVNQLVQLLTDYYRMQGDETRSKAEAWMQSGEVTVSGRERDVELATYHVHCSVLEVRGQIEGLKEERQFLLLLIG